MSNMNCQDVFNHISSHYLQSKRRVCTLCIIMNSHCIPKYHLQTCFSYFSSLIQIKNTVCTLCILMYIHCISKYHSLMFHHLDKLKFQLKYCMYNLYKSCTYINILKIYMYFLTKYILKDPKTKFNERNYTKNITISMKN